MLRRTLRSLSLTVALLPLLAGAGCSNRVEKTAEEVKASYGQLMARVQEGKARWAWSGEPAEASRTGAAIESVLLPAWKLKSRYDEWWETEGHEASSDTEFFMLPGAAMDPHFESADAKWLFTEPGLEQVRSALLGAVAEEFEGEQEDDLLPISYQALAAKGMVSLLIRRDLERGDHEAAVQGLVALQRFGELWLAREGVISSLTGFYLLQIRWEFWHLIQEGVTAKVGEPMEEMIAVADLATEFAGRESAMMETLESLLKRPLAEAVVEALRMADEAEDGIFEYWYWQAVHSYLHGLATARSDLEMLQLALKAR